MVMVDITCCDHGTFKWTPYLHSQQSSEQGALCLEAGLSSMLFAHRGIFRLKQENTNLSNRFPWAFSFNFGVKLATMTSTTAHAAVIAS